MRQGPAHARRGFAIWLLLQALLIGFEGARLVCGDQKLLVLMQVR